MHLLKYCTVHPKYMIILENMMHYYRLKTLLLSPITPGLGLCYFEQLILFRDIQHVSKQMQVQILKASLKFVQHIQKTVLQCKI